MKRKDLKSGMIIELRKDGVNDLGLIVQTDLGLVAQFNNTFISLSSFNPDLTCESGANLDIVSVRKPEFDYQIIREDLHKAKVIWERKEKENRIIGNWYKNKHYLVCYLGDNRGLGYDLEDGNTFTCEHSLSSHFGGGYKLIETSEAAKIML